MSLKVYLKSPRGYWLRWIAVLPIALLTMIVVSPIIKILFDVSLFFNPPFFSKEVIKLYFVAFVAGMFNGNIIIASVAYIAPKHKHQTALVIGSITILISVVVLLTGYTNPEYNPLFENVGLIIGIIIRYMMVKEENTFTNS